MGVVASGGLTHFVIDEELDRGFLKALETKDAGLHDRRSPTRCCAPGTSEYRNWIVVAGALADSLADGEGRGLPAVLPLRGRHRMRHGLRRLGQDAEAATETSNS